MLFNRTNAAQMSPADVAAAAARGEVDLIDVREEDERRAARPAGSRHIPLADLPGRLDDLRADRTVAFICRSGGRSAIATRAAAERGLPVANVRGGLLAWQDAGLRVDTGSEPNAATRKDHS